MILDSTMEKFYLGILDYAGMEIKDDVVVDKNEAIGEISLDGKKLALPYYEILKNPEGRVIFHLLNENYTNPENSIFNLFRKRLTLELNLKLSSVIVGLILVASDPQIQHKAKSGALISLISNLGATEPVLISNFLDMIKASKKENAESFLIDIFLKKNGEVKGDAYGAIGKINFLFYKEVDKALNDGNKDYRVYGYKARRKDLVALDNILTVLFPNIDTPEEYTEGTNNKGFRYLNILLKTAYQITHRINEVVSLLEEVKEESLDLGEMRSNEDWVAPMEKLYSMIDTIRTIPNQVDLSIESNKLRLDESKASAIQQPQVQQQPVVYQPPVVDQTRLLNATVQAPVQQTPVQQQALSAEDIVRGNIGYPVTVQQQQPMVMQPYMNQMQQPQQMVPQWVMAEQIRNNQLVQPTVQGVPAGLVPINQYQVNGLQPQYAVQPMPMNMQYVANSRAPWQ